MIFQIQKLFFSEKLESSLENKNINKNKTR